MRIFNDGQLIGDNKINYYKGKGNYAEVYNVYNDTNKIEAALKVCHLQILPEDKKRFSRENDILHKLKVHDYIVAPLSNINNVGNYCFYLMEWVESNLEEFIDKTNCDFKIKIDIFKNICIAIQHAHKLNVIHRDLWWANILIKSTSTGEIPKISDFGRAKDFDAFQGSNLPLEAWGHAFVRPPEIDFKIWSEEELSKYSLSDIYALGIILFYLFYGRPIAYYESLSKSYRMFKIGKPDIDVLSATDKENEYYKWIKFTETFPNIKLNFSFPDNNITIKLNSLIERLCNLDYKKRFKNLDDILLEINNR